MCMPIITDLIICGVGLLKMINLRKSTASLNPKNSWHLPIDDNFHFSHNCLKNFDQNGYDLTSLEREYALVNGAPLVTDGWRSAVKQTWFACDSIDGPHIDHSYLYERKTFKGAALEQMKKFAEKVPMAYKVIRLRAKWGIDVSIDYVSKEHAFELFHYEWDDFNLDNVLEKQYEVEKIILNQYDQNIDIFWASGACFFIRKNTYELLNGFDENFIHHMEEIDLCWRILKSGFKFFLRSVSRISIKYIINSTTSCCSFL